MQIEAVSIFPDYFQPLELSLLGKAQEAGLVSFKAHDLRSWTQDRHKTVDDSPYGGGAGMVMKPDVWGLAFDDLIPEDSEPVVVFTTPAGIPFTQALAQELASEQHIIFACGRYEGIDQRVVEHTATRARVLEVSIGDYVLNGGEVAAMVMVEAITRLIPGFMGNAESIVEESHSDGLLEYPSYTKPSVWRELEVPAVLLSGHHGEIEKWRKAQQLERTKANRPDLLL
jgi:tRNA (guanine37-N1)-methyltransferase